VNAFFLLSGIALIAIVFIDALWTTLWVDGGAGPLTSRLTNWMWRGHRSLVGKRNDRRLSLFGPFILLFSLLVWVALLWCGWALIFASHDLALLHSREQTPADWSDRFYFVGYMIFTAGNGDFTPSGDGWQITSSLTNATGMILVTLSITYLLSVVSAVVSKRAFASQVTGLGSSAVDFIANGWNGHDLRGLDLPLSGMVSSLSVLAQQYEAYPVLQYYHGAKTGKSPIVALVVLDEALTLMRFGVAQQVRPTSAVLHSARAAVASLLETMPNAFIKDAPDVPHEPALAKLDEIGIPTAAPSEFQACLSALSHRRKSLLGLLLNDGWVWEDVEK
jgi:hypothetical protein